jgi:transposase
MPPGILGGSHFSRDVTVHSPLNLLVQSLKKVRDKLSAIGHTIRAMTRLTKDDLAQMDRQYLEALEHGRLVDVACNLRDFAVEQVERLGRNSTNSSKPPSSDSPYQKGAKEAEKQSASADDTDKKDTARVSTPTDEPQPRQAKRSSGKQPGGQGFWRSEPLIPEAWIPHGPEHCAACGAGVHVPENFAPYMGHHVLELERTSSGIRISCTLHQYYASTCACGHETRARPGEGYVSSVEGRKKDLKLTEYVLVGPMLATFLAALSNRYRMSRVKIKEFLACWMTTARPKAATKCEPQRHGGHRVWPFSGRPKKRPAKRAALVCALEDEIEGVFQLLYVSSCQ